MDKIQRITQGLNKAAIVLIIILLILMLFMEMNMRHLTDKYEMLEENYKKLYEEITENESDKS